MRNIFVFIAFLLCMQARAQYNRGVFFEIGGSGGLGSLNFEKAFRDETNVEPITTPEYIAGRGPYTNYFWRFGFSISPIDKNNGWVLVFPVMIHGVLFPKANHIEFGGGFAPSISTKGAFFVRSPLMLGYRRQNPDKKIFYRVTYTPIVSWLVDFQWENWFGVSIGYKLS